ncbi:MAG: YitT family protein [Lachnospiraceae bacterium]|nr:YitT family protein [Lachnospiraceae bacterium]
MTFNPHHQLKNILLSVAGALILAFGVALFIIPFDLVVGGVSGIAIILSHLLPVPFLTTDLLITVITWGLFFLGLIFLGRDFALKTLISTIVYPLGISVFSRLTDPDVMNGMFSLSKSAYSEIAILLAVIFGGVLIGTGCALTFLGGGSTGGVDVLAFIICKKMHKIRSSTVIFIIDVSAILLGFIVFNDLVISLLGITSAFITAMVIDKLFLGESNAFIAQIISDHYREINQLIAAKLRRTTSIIDIEGGYSGKAKKMLMISFTMNQYHDLFNIINQIDSTAFVTIHRAHEINGKGWTR